MAHLIKGRLTLDITGYGCFEVIYIHLDETMSEEGLDIDVKSPYGNDWRIVFYWKNNKRIHREFCKGKNLGAFGWQLHKIFDVMENIC